MRGGWRDRRLVSADRLVAPFLVIMVLAFGAAGLWLDGIAWGLVGAAAGITALLALLAGVFRWSRWQMMAVFVLAVGCDAVIGLLREAQGQGLSGYDTLALLPMVWVALTLDRRAVVAISACTGALFWLPLALAGSPVDATLWRPVVLWTAIVLAVGLAVNQVVVRQRRQADDLARTQQALAAIAAVAREIATSVAADVRTLVCETATAQGGCAFATIVEPTADGTFRITGSAGIHVPIETLHEAVQPSASLRAFFSGERVFLADACSDPGVASLILEATGVRSTLFEPILRNGKPIGVLTAGWTDPLPQLPERTISVFTYLAAETSAALERADLLDRLDTLAHTDELTGLPNRRSWERTLSQALAQPSARFCVALLDLDHFKHYNDTNGHTAGDALLQDAARNWSSKLRHGDILARYGGEEFAVLLRDCTLDTGLSIIERLRRSTPAITASAGIVERSTSTTAAQLIRRADTALYTAKDNGRNQLAAAS